MPMSVSTSSVMTLPQINRQSVYGEYGITYHHQVEQRSPSPNATRTLRIECDGRVIEWNSGDARLNLSRLRNYIRSAFFIDEQRQFSILYKPDTFSSKTQYRYVHDDASLRQALGNVDLVVEVQIHELHEDETYPEPSFSELGPLNRIDSPLQLCPREEGTTDRSLRLRTTTSKSQGAYSNIQTSLTLSHSPSASQSLVSSVDTLQLRKSSIFNFSPLDCPPSLRISGVTQTLRRKLQFTDEGLWKKFSARRLELIDSMSLSTKKSSEQYDVIIAVADTLRDEYGFPPHTLPDFDKLVRAAVQSVRRNRKRQPKSKARSMSLSVKLDVGNDEQGQRHQSQNMSLTEQWPLSPGPRNGSESISVSSDALSDDTKASTSPYGRGYFNYRPAASSGRSERSNRSPKLAPLSRLPLVWSPTESSSSSSNFSSAASTDDERDFYSTETVATSDLQDKHNLPRTLPGTASFILQQQSSTVLELVYGDRTVPCTIHRTDLFRSTESSLSFLLNSVRTILSLPENALVALYYFRPSDGHRIQIISEAEARLVMRVAPPCAAAQGLRVEVITMRQIQALHQQQQPAIRSASVPIPGLSSTSLADASQRISIASLVGP
ncbi:transcription factor Vhr1-domain-containing protein [Lipomyces doorenjongii]